MTFWKELRIHCCSVRLAFLLNLKMTELSNFPGQLLKMPDFAATWQKGSNSGTIPASWNQFQRTQVPSCKSRMRDLKNFPLCPAKIFRASRQCWKMNHQDFETFPLEAGILDVLSGDLLPGPSHQDVSPRRVNKYQTIKISCQLQGRHILRGLSTAGPHNAKASVLYPNPACQEGRLQSSWNPKMLCIHYFTLYLWALRVCFLISTTWQWSEWRLQRAWFSYSQSIKCHFLMGIYPKISQLSTVIPKDPGLPHIPYNIC